MSRLIKLAARYLLSSKTLINPPPTPPKKKANPCNKVRTRECPVRRKASLKNVNEIIKVVRRKYQRVRRE